MEFISKLVAFVVRLTLLAAGVIVAMEVIDILGEKKRSRYLVSEEFEE